MRFGKSDCSDIEIEPFSPICSYDNPGPSEPLTLDVPVPAFVHPVLPNECACFTFEKGESKTVVVKDCLTQDKANVSIEITQAGDDCCDGRYKVIPQVEIPCMPFDVSASRFNVINRSKVESRGVDGGISKFSVGKGACCELTSELTLELPDCVKYYNKNDLPEDQVTFCYRDDDGSQKTKTHKLVEIVTDPDECNQWPKVNPIELPCCTLPDGDTDAGAVDLDKRGSTMEWRLYREECDPKIEVTTNIVDCACFEFTSEKEETKVVKCDATGTRIGGKSWIDITREEGTDCCDGKFTVTPHIEVPCMPFTVSSPKVHVHTPNNPGITDGLTGAKVVVTKEQNCCTVDTAIDITLPPCTKTLPPLPPYQIKYLEKGAIKTANIVSYEEKEEECTWVPKITALDLPCPFADLSMPNEQTIDIGMGGSIAYKFNIEDCTCDFSMRLVNPISYTPPCPPYMACDKIRNSNSFWQNASIQYKKNDKDEKYTETSGKVGVTKGIDSSGCPWYKIDTLDLGTIKISSMENGGDIFIPSGEGGGGGGSSDNNGYIDGSSYPEDETWYAGGIGDLVNDVPNKFDCRGPKMRGTGTISEDDRIPYTNPATRMINDDLDTANIWQSARKAQDGSRTFSENAAKGNLSVNMPTGAQWTFRGIAYTHNTFLYNSSGVLSWMEETQSATILAPGLSIRRDAVNKTDQRQEDNTSGLALNVADPSNSTASPGLMVNTGYGLRIHGTDINTPGERKATDPLNGQLEIQYGAGFRIIKDKTKTTDYDKYLSIPSEENGAIELSYGPGLNSIETVKEDGTVTYSNAPGKIKGAIVPNDGRGLRINNVTKKENVAGGCGDTTNQNKLEIYGCEKDFAFHSSGSTNGALVLNDKKSSSEVQIATTTSGRLTGNTAVRNKGYEFSIPILVPNIPVMEEDGVVRVSQTGYRFGKMDDELGPVIFLEDTMLMYLHITESGLVLGIDNNPTASGISRHAEGTD